MTLKKATLMVAIFAAISAISIIIPHFYWDLLDTIYKLIIALFFFVLYKKMK